ncbi:hypothetical protein F4823DRAFT_618889 [Ustulina deusta]|nr:hypothetical protein F4823DRAFT_618889 [Ustulina deusta]
MSRLLSAKPLLSIPTFEVVGVSDGMRGCERTGQRVPDSETKPHWRSTQRSFFSFQSWWWWEIMALVICIGSTLGLIVLLKLINNTPLQQWSLPVQPNSVISVLTTINKTAMLVPAASCLSQLKWRYFSKQPRRLVDLQLFDAASRGPWGSMALLSQLSNPRTALMAMGFAVLTILTLGIDASAQQILAFPVKETEINTGQIVMGTAIEYVSKSNSITFQNQNLSAKLIPLQYALVNSLRGSAFESYYSCPQQATRCVWDSLTTLGICSSWTRAQIASDGCDMIIAHAPGVGGNATYADCNYTLSNQQSGNAALSGALYPVQVNLTFRIPTVDVNSGNKVLDSRFIPGPYKTQTEFGEFYALKAPDITTVFTSQEYFKPPVAEAFYASFWWCSQNFQGITVKSQEVEFEGASSEPLVFSSRDPTGSTEIDYTYTYFTESTGLNYSIDGLAYEALTPYLHDVLTTQAFNQIFDPVGDGVSPVLSVGRLLYQEDLGSMTSSLASTITNIIRSTHLDENSKVINIPGKAFYNEAYIQVRWIWILVPLLETTLITLLFTLSVIITSKEPLLKDSVLAYLSTSIRDDAGHESDLHLTQKATQNALNEQAEDMVLMLEPDDRGRLLFFRRDEGPAC